jgi:hypothetical protein
MLRQSPLVGAKWGLDARLEIASVGHKKAPKKAQSPTSPLVVTWVCSCAKRFSPKLPEDPQEAPEPCSKAVGYVCAHFHGQACVNPAAATQRCGGSSVLVLVGLVGFSARGKRMGCGGGIRGPPF